LRKAAARNSSYRDKPRISNDEITDLCYNISVITSAGANGMRAAILVLLLCPVCFCQESRKLSDSFADAALNALRAIETFIYTSYDNAPGKVVTLQKGKMDKAESAAMTPAEMSVNEALKRILKERMDNNARRETLTAQKEQQIGNRKEGDPPPTPVYEEPEFVSMEKKEEACFTAFERNLKAQNPAVPAQCNSLAAK
jgi:hypothetical protein